jgi:hypothetical protein
MTGHAAAGPNPGATDDWLRPIDWLALIEGTRRALATLSVDDLEELAVRAQALLDSVAGRASVTALSDEAMRKVVAGHRALGDLLRATAGNLAVVRRRRDYRSQEMNPPWAR